MKKFVEYEKLSKKQKRELDNMKRVTWGAMSPATRKAPNAKAYNRKKHQRGMMDPDAGVFYCIGNGAKILAAATGRFFNAYISIMRQIARSVVR